jgi:hypothetical protein
MYLHSCFPICIYWLHKDVACWCSDNVLFVSGLGETVGRVLRSNCRKLRVGSVPLGTYLHLRHPAILTPVIA